MNWVLLLKIVSLVIMQLAPIKIKMSSFKKERKKERKKEKLKERASAWVGIIISVACSSLMQITFIQLSDFILSNLLRCVEFHLSHSQINEVCGAGGDWPRLTPSSAPRWHSDHQIQSDANLGKYLALSVGHVSPFRNWKWSHWPLIPHPTAIWENMWNHLYLLFASNLLKAKHWIKKNFKNWYS